MIYYSSNSVIISGLYSALDMRQLFLLTLNISNTPGFSHAMSLWTVSIKLAEKNGVVTPKETDLSIKC